MILPEEDKARAVSYLENAGYNTKNIGKDTVAMLSEDKNMSILAESF
jgi:hypothetical protein